MRLPDSLILTPLGQSLITLVTSTTERNHARIYFQAENLFNLVRQEGFFDEKLSLVVTDLVLVFIGETLCFKALDHAQHRRFRHIPLKDIHPPLQGVHIVAPITGPNVSRTDPRASPRWCVV